METNKLTKEQNDRILGMLPYVDYVLNRKIPFIPEYLKEDARSVAHVALCRSAMLYDETRASFQTYAIQSMRKSVLNFLICEKAKNERSCEGTDVVAEQAQNSYFSNDLLKDLEEEDMLYELYHSNVMSDEIKEAFLMLSCGQTMEEVAEELRVPVPSLRNRIIKTRQKILRDERWKDFRRHRKFA